MSEHPREIWALEATGPDGNCHYTFRVPVRYILADGPEFEALMQRAREAVETPAYKNAMLKGDILRDLLAYFGEAP